MTLVFSTLLLGLAWFAVVNAAASAVAWWCAGACSRDVADVAVDRARANRLLALRLLPFAIAATVSLIVFTPAHLRFEPRDAKVTGETFGVVMYVLALVSAGLLCRSAWRAGSVLRAGRRLRRWSDGQQPSVRTAAADAYEVPFAAGISLAGVVRPRILIAERARRALTPAELDVAIAHELAHARGRDNAKRVMMFCVPDLFGATVRARTVEDCWRAEAECLADAAAVGGDDRRAAALASALVKVARLGLEPDGGSHSPAWSTFHEARLLKSRIQLLVGARVPAARGKGHVWGAVAFGVMLGVLAWAANAPLQLHHLTEALIALLP